MEEDTVEADLNALAAEEAQNEKSRAEVPSPTKSAVDDTSIYESVIFNIVVGPQKRVFTAHLDILSESPFFRAACQGPFREAKLRSLILEDDDPSLIKHLLNFLYTGDWEPRIYRDQHFCEYLSPISVDEDVRTTEFSNQARLYCLAEKYDVSRMKDVAIRKMNLLLPIPLESLVCIAEDVYTNLPPFDKAFRQLFRVWACKARFADEPDVEPLLLDAVKNGGLLAQDIFLALKQLHDDDKRREQPCEHCSYAGPFSYGDCGRARGDRSTTAELKPKRRVKQITQSGSGNNGYR